MKFSSKACHNFELREYHGESLCESEECDFPLQGQVGIGFEDLVTLFLRHFSVRLLTVDSMSMKAALR